MAPVAGAIGEVEPFQNKDFFTTLVRHLFRGTKMTLRRGSFGLAPASILFLTVFPGLSRFSGKGECGLALGAAGDRTASRAAGRTASGAAGRAARGASGGTARRAAGAAVAATVASAVVTVVAAAAVLAVLVALAVRFRDEVVEPAGERPARSLAAAAVTVACKSRSSYKRETKGGDAQHSI